MTKRSVLILLLITAIAVLPHALNMFSYPYYEADEGTYFSQAWAVATQGRLSPYEYWYDHAPLGWIFMALWVKIVGVFTFGFSINSGRVFMLVLHAFSSLFLYVITYRITKSKFAGLVSVVFFSLSPLAIYFHRRILLDNISVFWLLLSMFIITGKFSKTLSLVLSSVFMGVAILTKETAVLLVPAYIFMFYKEPGPHVYSIPEDRENSFNESFLWLLILFGVLLLYPAYAFSRGELFSGGGGVSLMDALAFQFSRGTEGSLAVTFQRFQSNLSLWLGEDPLYIFIGGLSVLVNIILGIKNKTALVLALSVLPTIIYLIFNGTVFEFYIIMLLPFFALNIAYMFSFAVIAAGRRRAAELALYAILATAAALMVLHFSDNSKNDFNIYTSDQTRAQVDAIEWLKQNSVPGSLNVIDNYAYVDLNTSGSNARYDYYWKVDTDPQIAENLLNNSIDRIEYIAITPQMQRDAQNSEVLRLTRQLIQSAQTVQFFESDGWSVEIKRNL
jgi:4-amino-4-deoxy-L-arabinose transferase-like glycosyltransferase